MKINISNDKKLYLQNVFSEANIKEEEIRIYNLLECLPPQARSTISRAVSASLISRTIRAEIRQVA